MELKDIKNVLGNATMQTVGTVISTWETSKSKGLNVSFKETEADKYFETISISCESIADIREGDYVEVTGRIASYFDNKQKKSVYYFNKGKVRRL